MSKIRLSIITGIILVIVIAGLAALVLTNQSPQDVIIPTLMASPPTVVSEHQDTATPASTAEIPVQVIGNTGSPAPTDAPLPPAASPIIVATPFSTIEPITIAVPDHPVENQVVIRFDPTTSQEQRTEYVASINGTITQSIETLDTVVVNVSPETAAQPLPPSPIVAASEPDYYVSALIDVPTSDEYYDQQWALPVIGAPDAWLEMPDDAPMVMVAVIDSGVCLDHPDLAGRILPGYDFVDDDTIPQDDLGHGCGVAGIIAANIDNGIGIAGVASNAQILPLRVLDAQGIGTYSDVSAAIVYAADNGAQIINLSLGGANPSTVLENAIDYAISKGVMVIAAAGNIGGSVLWPAAYDPVIAVGSVDPDLQLSSFSSRGLEIDLLAPGRNIFATANNSSFTTVSGTSFAAPHVAGVAALEMALGESVTVDGGVVGTNLSDNRLVNQPTMPPSSPTESATQLPVLSVDFDTVNVIPLDYRQPIMNILEANRSILPQVLEFSSTAFRTSSDGNWARIVLVPTYIIDARWEIQFDPKEIIEILAQRSPGGDWNAYLYIQEDFHIVTQEVPRSFIDFTETVSTLSNQEYRFPWTDNQTWWKNGGWHSGGWGLAENAIDFQPQSWWTDASYLAVLSASSGSLDSICDDGSNQTWLRISNSDGMSGYGHLDGSTVRRDLLGQTVVMGQYLGNLYNPNPGGSFDTYCGNGASPHFHFVFPTHAITMFDKITNSAIPADTIGINTGIGNVSYISNNIRIDNSLSLPPANTNLVRNSDFSNGTANWTPSGNVTYEVVDGVMKFGRQVTGVDGALDQALNYYANANMPFEIVADLENTSDQTRKVALLFQKPLRSDDSFFICEFDIPPHSPLQQYTMRGRTNRYWENIDFQTFTYVNDGVRAIGIDNISVTYRPDLNPQGTECTAHSQSKVITSASLYDFVCSPPLLKMQIAGNFDIYDGYVGPNNELLDLFGVRILDGANNILLQTTFGAEVGSTNFAPDIYYLISQPTRNPLRLQVYEAVDYSGFGDLLAQFPFDWPCFIPETELEALEALYNSTNGPHWTNNSGWMSTTSPCAWYGVTCKSGHVAELNLGVNKLQGPLPASLSNLTQLERVWFSYNQLSGSIPVELGNLANLEYLYLWDNDLIGGIPASLGNLNNLKVLSLGMNQFTGSIPSTLGNLADLTGLYLCGNQLSGSIPPELGNLTNLTTLNLASNRLSGSIPPELGNLSSLTQLYLDLNQLSGSIPPELGNLTNLTTLLLYVNQLTGNIPPELGNLTNLTDLGLNNNRLDGSIPPELGNLVNLDYLNLGNNALRGEIPATIVNLGSLSTTGIGYNALYAADQAVIDFLNVKSPNWANTQTVAPTNVTVVSTVAGAVNLSWTPILYTGNGGYYEISYALNSGGSYTVAGTTANKSASSYAITGLIPGLDYNFRVRTYTPAQGSQANALWSDYSAPVTRTVVSAPNAAPLRGYYTTDTPTLTWNRVTGATEYEIQVDNAATFTAPLSFTTTVPANTLSVTTTALPDGVYYWRVRAKNSSTTGAWSAVDSLVIDVE